MSRSRKGLAAALCVALAAAPAAAGTYPGVGRTAKPAEIKAWDIDVRPDFKGLPPGSGSVAKGQGVWDAKCASCHGTFGESNEVFTPLVGGTTAEDVRTGRVKALTRGEQRTTLMKVATLSTLWDYINRAMPWNAPKTLTTEEVYAVLAYLLNLGDIVPGDFVLSDRNMAEVQAKLPNRNGMTRDHGLWNVADKGDVANVPCMKNCPVGAQPASSLPEHAREAHGNLAQQNRLVGPVRGIDTAEGHEKAEHKAVTVADLARDNGCLTCHAADKRVVGPAFREVARKYQGQEGAERQLLSKLRRGGSGDWGAVPMPAYPDMAEADAKALLGWILAGAS